VTHRHDILAERLNAQPAIFRGCSAGELGVIAGAAALIWLPLSLVLAGLAGAITMGFGIAGLGIVATVLAIASLFQRLKRNRPDGYYQQQFIVWLGQRRWRRSPFVRRTGYWDIGRAAHAPLSPSDR
jgi:conjugative transfer region protein (TIGR03750 family)